VLLRGFRKGSPPEEGSSSSSSSNSVLSSLAGSSWASLAVQPEGAPTNGKALLSLRDTGLPALGQALAAAAAAAPATAAAAAAAAAAPRCRVLALHYSSSGDSGRFSPCFLYQASPAYHAMCLLSHWGNAVALHSLPQSFDPLPTDFAQATRASEWPAAIVLAWENLLKRFGKRGLEANAALHAKFVQMALEGRKAQ